MSNDSFSVSFLSSTVGWLRFSTAMRFLALTFSEFYAPNFHFFSNFHFRHLIAFFLPPLYAKSSCSLRKPVAADRGLASNLSGLSLRYLNEDAFGFDALSRRCLPCRLGAGAFWNAKYEHITRISTLQRCLICEMERTVLYSSAWRCCGALVSCLTSRFREDTVVAACFLSYLFAPFVPFPFLPRAISDRR